MGASDEIVEACTVEGDISNSDDNASNSDPNSNIDNDKEPLVVPVKNRLDEIMLTNKDDNNHYNDVNYVTQSGHVKRCMDVLIIFLR